MHPGRDAVHVLRIRAPISRFARCAPVRRPVARAVVTGRDRLDRTTRIDLDAAASPMPNGGPEGRARAAPPFPA